ncbi:MAG: hypothetical protein JWL62_3471 [Hyphomicrobiales bacterium]|nr:hypothetical protein [Hyphomicrobiales bacterium]
MKLIDNWRAESRRLWTMRVSLFWTLFWSAIGALTELWPSLADVIPLKAFIALGVLMPVSHALARLMKQPGADT